MTFEPMMNRLCDELARMNPPSDRFTTVQILALMLTLSSTYVESDECPMVYTEHVLFGLKCCTRHGLPQA